MRAYVLFNFWFGVFALFVRLGLLGWANYPRVSNHSRGEDVIFLAISVSLTLWAAWLLWAKQY